MSLSMPDQEDVGSSCELTLCDACVFFMEIMHEIFSWGTRDDDPRPFLARLSSDIASPHISHYLCSVLGVCLNMTDHPLCATL